MPIHNKSTLSPSLHLTILVFIFNLKHCSEARILLVNIPSAASTEFIRNSCNRTLYPSLCFNSLVSHASTIRKSPDQLAYTELSLSLISARSLSAAMHTMSARGGMSPGVADAIRDCIDTIVDSVDELKQSKFAMAHLRGNDVAFQINSIQTWVSAALTNDDTCTDGVASSAMNRELKTAVRRHVVNTAQLTSNALALINELASEQSSAP